MVLPIDALPPLVPVQQDAMQLLTDVKAMFDKGRAKGPGLGPTMDDLEQLLLKIGLEIGNLQQQLSRLEALSKTIERHYVAGTLPSQQQMAQTREVPGGKQVIQPGQYNPQDVWKQGLNPATQANL